MERKVDAVLCHTSQIDGRSREEMLRRWTEGAKRDRDRRKRTGYEFAESFKRLEFRRPVPTVKPEIPPEAKG
jgi:hypothetical protein